MSRRQTEPLYTDPAVVGTIGHDLPQIPPVATADCTAPLSRIFDPAGNAWALQLVRFRRVHGLKQAVLAEMLGVDQATISRWETGRMIPDRAMQRRFQNLVRRRPSEASLVTHRTVGAIGEIAVTNRSRIFIAASPAYCASHGVPPDKIVGRTTTPQHTVESERVYQAAVERGFFRGDIASATVLAHANSLSGHVKNRCTKAVWSAVRLDSGQIVLRTERVSLSDAAYLAAWEDNGGHSRFVMMDDLVL